MEVDTKVRGIVLNKLMAQAHKELDLKGKQMTKEEDKITYKFNENYTIEQIKRYVDSTYERHYGYGKYQATDMIIDAGYGESFCIGNIMKYAMRYGKKPCSVTGEYKNQGVLLKIIHYAIIAIHLWTEEKTKSETD